MHNKLYFFPFCIYRNKKLCHMYVENNCNVKSVSMHSETAQKRPKRLWLRFFKSIKY